MKKNVASQIIGAQMVSATDGSAFTGAVTVAVTGDGGTQATGSVGAGACTHEGNGYHTYAPAQAETNYDLVAFTFTGTGAIPATVQVYTTFPQTGDSYARLGAPAGASVSADIAAIEAQTDDIGVAGAGLTAVPWNAAWDAEVQSEVADALAVYDPPTNAEMEARTLLAASYATAANQTAIAGYIDTEVAAILTAIGMPAVDLAADLAAVKVDTAAILVDTGTTLQAELDGIQADTEDIQSRLPAALTGAGNMKSDALAISGSTESADRLERSTLAIVTGTCAGSGTTTSVIASALSPTSAVNDQFNGRIITFDKDTTTTALRGQATDITDYVHSSLTFTVTALTTAPQAGDTFTIT